MREMATERVERRVARALLRLAREAGKRTEAGIEIAMPLSRQDVAEMTGTTLYTVSRLLSAWEQDGLVETGRQRVVIKQAHALVKIAEDLPDA
jgi:CRP-like cAMP-binding protein